MSYIKRFNENSLLDPMDNWKSDGKEDDKYTDRFGNSKFKLNVVEGGIKDAIGKAIHNQSSNLKEIKSNIRIKSIVDTLKDGSYEYEITIKRNS